MGSSTNLFNLFNNYTNWWILLVLSWTNERPFDREDKSNPSFSKGKTNSESMAKVLQICPLFTFWNSLFTHGSSHPVLFHSMKLHFTEQIHNRVGYSPGKPYPPDLITVYGLYPDPPTAIRYPNSDPPTQFYSTLWPYIIQSGFTHAYTIPQDKIIHRIW